MHCLVSEAQKRVQLGNLPWSMSHSDGADNQAQLLLIGRILMQDTISIMIQTMIWGLYLLLFVYALKIQM
jgi:hypothetical protein